MTWNVIANFTLQKPHFSFLLSDLKSYPSFLFSPAIAPALGHVSPWRVTVILASQLQSPHPFLKNGDMPLLWANDQALHGGEKKIIRESMNKMNKQMIAQNDCLL